MSGKRSSMDSEEANISFDHNSTATEANTQDFIETTSSEHIPLNTATQEHNSSGWNMGESSSNGTQNYAIHNLNLNTFPLDLNSDVEVGGNSGSFREEISSSEGNRLPCKRRAVEGLIGQSSSSGSSSCVQPRESNNGNNNSSFYSRVLERGWNDTSFGTNTSSGSLENPIIASPRDQLNISGTRAPQSLRLVFTNNNNNNNNNNSNNNNNNNNILGSRAPQSSRATGAYAFSSGDSIAEPFVEPELNMLQRNLNINRNFSGRATRYSRRSLLSESGGQNSNFSLQAGSSSGQVAPSSGVDPVERLSSQRLLETLHALYFGGANSSGTGATGSVGRSRVVTERQSVLDRIRRGETILDVDNMSYEGLLALEERMGNVDTGLSEKTIMKRLKQKKFFSIALGEQTEVEPCCICQEEYNDLEDIGTVDCGHEFHTGCIKKWLMIKNSCPICKRTALDK